MLLKDLRTQVLEANLELVHRGLVLYTFGNASGIDRDQNLVVIKPSGVDYDELVPELMVVTDLHGNIVDGQLKPSSDLDTHTLLYREFPPSAPSSTLTPSSPPASRKLACPSPPLAPPTPTTSTAQSPVRPPYRRSHRRPLRSRNRPGHRRLTSTKHEIDPLAVPACLVNGHAPFCWGKDAHAAAHNAVSSKP